MTGVAKAGRNDACPCGSGKKFKHCCEGKIAASGGVQVTNLKAQAGRLLRAGNVEQALPLLIQAIRLSPEDASVAHDIGTVLARAGRLDDAIPWLRRAISLRPRSGESYFELAVAHESRGDPAGALEAYRATIARAPNEIGAYARMGELLARLGKPFEAAVALDQAAALSPNTTVGGLCGAKASALRSHPDEAAQRLERVIQREPTVAEAHTLLGMVLSESGRFREAAPAFERAIALAPGDATAHHGLVTSRPLTEADRSVLARIASVLALPRVPLSSQVTLHFAAGKGHEDLGDYETAMKHFDAANRGRQRLARPFDPGDLEERVRRLVARYTPAFFAEHASSGSPDELPIFVLGMPRSGTTLVERVLSSHPEVAAGGELPYWNHEAPALVEADLPTLATGARSASDNYITLLKGISADASRVTDKMPFNFLWIGLLHALFPKARFIHCRRDPVDTCLSMYTTLFAQHWGFASDRRDLAAYYRQYVRLMDHWRSALPASVFLDVDYEQMVAVPDESARRLVTFAGLAWDDACLAPDRNAAAVQTASKWQARQPLFKTSVERWRRFEPWLGELASLASR